MNTNVKNTKIDYRVLIVLIIIVLVVAYFMLFKDLFKDKNAKKEEEMVAAAMEYVSQNSLYNTHEIYLDVSKINVSLDEGCSVLSGVIYDGYNYTPNLVCQDYQ